jgi:cell division protein FtsQ
MVSVLKKKSKNRRKKEPVAKRLKKGMAIILRVAFVVMGIPAALYGSWYLYQMLLVSPLLEIEHVDVSGVDRVSKEDVISLTGITAGNNLIAVDKRVLTRRLKKEPWIDTVAIKRRLPNRLVIEIKEMRPIAIISMDDLYLVDARGVVFKGLSKDDGIDLPIITGLSIDELDKDEASALLFKAFDLIKILSKERVFGISDISEINIDKNYGLAVYTLKEGIKIDIGSSDFEEKLERLERLISKRNGNFTGVEYIDMNNPRGVIMRMSENIEMQI